MFNQKSIIIAWLEVVSEFLRRSILVLEIKWYTVIECVKHTNWHSWREDCSLSSIGDHSRCWLSCIGPLVLLFSKTFKLFWLWSFLNMLSQKRVMRTKFDISFSMTIVVVNTSTSTIRRSTFHIISLHRKRPRQCRWKYSLAFWLLKKHICEITYYDLLILFWRNDFFLK